jgi:hypothetical protein
MIKLFNKTKSFSLQEIYDKVKSGEITIDYRGHGPNDLKYMFEREEKNFKEDLVNGNEERIKNAKDNLSRRTEIGKWIWGGHCGSGQCFLCDHHINYVLKDEKTIGIITSDSRWDLVEGKKLTEEHLLKCEGEELSKTKCLTAEIQAPTGQIAIQNYFDTEEIYELPKEVRYERPTINCLLGRDRLMQYLASKDVGYGQMGNMSIYIYANSEEILVIDENDERPNKKLKVYLKQGKYKKLGEISLRVWRWMCADVSVLEKYGEKPKDIVATVQPGTYIVEHFAHSLRRKALPIYSRIRLKK